MYDLKDAVALVTGAATGIGRAIAVRMAREGAHVAILDVHEAEANRTAAMVTVAFLASGEADYMTGQAINVTGGLWMG